MIHFDLRRLIRQGALILIALPVLSASIAIAQQPLWKSPAYTLYADSVVQNKYVAKAISRQEIASGYQSPANEFKTSAISFKFSINGKDNEMVSGTDHHFNVDTKNLISETPLISFGHQLKPKKGEKPGYLKPGTRLTVKLDMRAVLNEFKTKGYYTCFDGSKIYKEDFKGVYIAGSSAPLIWDFDNLVHHPQLRLGDENGDGIYEIILNLNVKEDEKRTLSHWKLEKDLSAFPRYESSYLLSDALYNMALEEMIRAVEPDSTLRTGKEWAGVWTRDVSYSIILSMAHLQPQAARYSLLRKVDKKKKIIQDTGTGGAWPISTDRMIWAVAAWEVYKVTGDREWLKEAYEVIKNSILADMQTIYDPETGLVKGESSFLDWREQTYPLWMQPADIFESENLGTNAVHFKANKVAAAMAGLLNDKSADIFEQNADRIRQAVNEKFWLPAKNYYAQYLYGRAVKSVSPRAEALGAALCVIFGIAGEEQTKQLVRSMPLSPFGITCIYPQIPGIPPYHNNGIWPFVQSFWMWAGVEARNEQSVMESIAAIYRPAALFVTNKENFVAENGDYAGTQINSSNMLWSLSGNLSIVHHVLFGIRFENDQLRFSPFVPEALKGNRKLENFRYRNAILNISLEGYGDEIASFHIDGKSSAEFSFPAGMTGAHTIHIVLRKSAPGADAVNRQTLVFSPATPELTYKNNVLSWKAIPGAIKYKLLAGGRVVTETKGFNTRITPAPFSEYQLIAIDKNGVESFASEPLVINHPSVQIVCEMEDLLQPAAYPYKGYSGKGFVETSTTVNTKMTIPVTVTKDGEYLIDFRYANGNGPVNTDNKCAVRNLWVDGQMLSAIVFPQRGKDEWSEWGWSNALRISLRAGVHTLVLDYQPADENMNIAINQAMLDQVRLRKVDR
ncbi:MAG: hypothetical protein KA821_03535 [Chitinophagaceae bacterium]|nr:hypothetical protein [Chitinophagaceae bacterium]